MLRALRDGKEWRSANTRVTAPDAQGVAHVYLHDNHIAERAPGVLAVTLAGWNTPTTRSRLNALLRDCTTRGVYSRRGTCWLSACGEDRHDHAKALPLSSRDWFGVEVGK